MEKVILELESIGRCSRAKMKNFRAKVDPYEQPYTLMHWWHVFAFQRSQEEAFSWACKLLYGLPYGHIEFLEFHIGNHMLIWLTIEISSNFNFNPNEPIQPSTHQYAYLYAKDLLKTLFRVKN